jgi:hypothetical protein
MRLHFFPHVGVKQEIGPTALARCGRLAKRLQLREKAGDINRIGAADKVRGVAPSFAASAGGMQLQAVRHQGVRRVAESFRARAWRPVELVGAPPT